MPDKAFSLRARLVRIYDLDGVDKASLFLTMYKPGTGKSVLLRGKSKKNSSHQTMQLIMLLAIIEKLRSIHGTGVAVTASTGIAACNISGCTLHR